jgi:nucleotide-binding universal stress UspA family protein
VIDSPLSVVAAIVNYADREKADLIVIGTRGRSGVSRMLLGSVASGVVTYAPCPVLVVK